MRPEDLFSPETARDPYPFYRMMRDQHPLYFHEGLKSFVVSRHADVESILRSPKQEGHERDDRLRSDWSTRDK